METFSRGTAEALDPWYVTGFIEGNGSFTYSRSGRQLGLHFAIKLAERDRNLLEDLREFFGGAGRIYDVRPASAYLRITHRDELERILVHFDDYPLHGAKSAAFAIWREMVLLRCRHFRQDRRDELEGLAARLSALSGTSRRRRFDRDEPVG